MRVLFLFFLMGCGWSGRAQLIPAGRLQLAVSPLQPERYALLPLGEQGGLLTLYSQATYARQPHRFEFTRLDTALHTRWQTNYTVPPRYVPQHTFDNSQYLFQFYTQPDTEKMAVFRLNLDEGTTDLYEGLLPSGLTVSQFKVMGNVAYLAGLYRLRPVVMAFSFFDRSVRVFQGLYVNNITLGSLEVDPYRQEVHVLTSSPKKRCQFALRSYSPDGKPLRVIEYDGTQHSLISGKILPVSANESLLVGNYSADCTPYSQGIYITRIHHTETGKLTVTTDRGEAIRYFDFSSLKNFFNYLKPRRHQKLLARMLKRRQEGRAYKFHYRLLVHDLMPTPTGLRVAAEVYYPQYRGNTYGASYSRSLSLEVPGSPGTLPAYGSGARPGPDRTTAGYQFTHAFICEFDRAGNLVWDNCLPLKDLTSVTLSPKVQILPLEKQIVLAYMKEDAATTQLIARDSVVRQDNPLTVVPTTREKVLSRSDETIQAWFGPYFLTTGYQKIGPARAGGLPRDVFYVNKLRYSLSPPAPGAARSNP